MSYSNAEIAKQRAKVQRLTDLVHNAKVKIDRMLWGPGGLPTNFEALHRCMVNLRNARGPNSVHKNISDAFLPDLNYKRLRAQWIIAKAELDSMLSIQQIPDTVKVARRRMEEQFKADIVAKVNEASLSGGEFILSQDPELQKRVEEAVNEAIQKAKTEKSVGSVVYLTETIGAAMSMGYTTSKSDQALKTAASIGKTLASDAAKQSRNNPNSKTLQEAAIRTEALSQCLGNEPANQDVILR